MNYCPNCGVQINDSANFCSECGEQIETETAVVTEHGIERHPGMAQRKDRRSTGRVQLNTVPGAERIYNIENISYFQNLNQDYILLANAGFVALVISALGAGAAVDNSVITIVGIFVAVTAWSVLSPDDGLVIGTLANKDEIDTDNPNTVETDFLEKTSNQISIRGVIRSPLYELEYTYHFLKKNVISIERFGSLNRIWPVLASVLGIGGLATAYMLVNSEPTVGNINMAVSIGIISNLVICGGAIYLYYGIYSNSIQFYFSKVEAYIYFVSGFIPFLLVPFWFFILEELNDFSSLVASGSVQEVQLFSAVLTGSSVLLIILMLSLPPAGVLISLPSNEQIQFSMTDEDARTIIEEFRKYYPSRIANCVHY